MQLTTPQPDRENQSQKPPNDDPVTLDLSETDSDLPMDVVFGLLSNERRRRVVEYLRDQSRRTTLSDLAEYVAAVENEKPEQALSSTERKRVYIVLYQCHLPKMDDANVIDFDENRKTVEAGENLSVLMQYLPDGTHAHNDDKRRDGSVYLLLASATGGVFLVQSYSVANPWLSGVLIGIFLVAIVTAATKRYNADSLFSGPMSVSEHLTRRYQ